MTLDLTLVILLREKYILLLPKVEDVVNILKLRWSQYWIPAYISELNVEEIFAFLLGPDWKRAFFVKSDLPNLTIKLIIWRLIAHLPISALERDYSQFIYI